MRVNRVALLAFASLLCAAPAVWADPIPGLFNTGVGGSGSVLPVGTADPHYAMTGPLSGALVITPNVLWVAAPAGSAWIGPATGTISHPAGAYTYSLSFDLSGFDPGTAAISGSWANDNDAAIYLNGVATGLTNNVVEYLALSAFSISSGFQPGVNTLEFRVTNSAAGTGIINPTGLLVSNLRGEASRLPVPEPSSLLLVVIGSVAFAGRRRRRRS